MEDEDGVPSSTSIIGPCVGSSKISRRVAGIAGEVVEAEAVEDAAGAVADEGAREARPGEEANISTTEGEATPGGGCFPCTVLGLFLLPGVEGLAFTAGDGIEVVDVPPAPPEPVTLGATLGEVTESRSKEVDTARPSRSL